MSASQPLVNGDIQAAPAVSKQGETRRQYSLAALLFLAVLILVIVITQTTGSACDGGFEWWGISYCPGDCVIQGSADEEYCPMEDERPMLMYEIDTNENAKCMDGTTTRIHYRESLPGDHENHWIIRMEGGALCYDPWSCGIRTSAEAAFTTTAQTPIIYQDSPEGGVLSGDPAINPHFHDYNAITPHYCSSDSWAGNSTLEENGDYWFMGYTNIIASMEMAEAHWNLTSADKIVLSGMSAGGQGLSSVAEHLKAWLDEHVPNAEVFFVIDSGWFLPSSPSYGFEDEVTEYEVSDDEYGTFICDYWDNCPLSNISALQCDYQGIVVPQSCLDAGFSCAECLYPEYNMATSSTHDLTLVIENLFDHQQTSAHVARNVELTEDQEIGLATDVADSIQSSAYSYVLPNCDNHDYMPRIFSYTVNLDGWVVADYMTDFIDNGRPQYSYADPISNEDGTTAKLSNPTCPDMGGVYNNPQIF